MNQLNFYLQNNQINPPKNWTEIGIECNFQDGEFKSQQVTINDWDFVRENIDVIQGWISAGYIFEGMPFRIEEVQETNGNIITIFDGFLDLTEMTKFDEYGIVAKSKQRYSIDWLNDTAAGFGFEFLASPEVGLITNADYIDIPYIISAIPNYKESAMAIISLTLSSQMLIQSASEITATLLALTSDPLSYGEVLRLISQIINFTISIVVIIKLIQKIFDLLIQKIKYHKGIKLRTLFEKGCQFLNLTFDSSVIPNDWYILPKKYVVPKNPNSSDGLGILGAFTPNEFPQFGYPKESFSEFIIKMKDLFNGKVLMNESLGNLRFERKDFSTIPPSYIMPPVENTSYELNTNEFISNLLIEFNTDVSESNTITQYKGAGYQITQRPINIINPENILMKGLRMVNLQYALGKRKTELTTVENLFDNLLEALDAVLMPFIFAINVAIAVANALIDVINDFIDFVEIAVSFDFPNIPNIIPIEYTGFGLVFDNRIGMLLLENDYFMQDKLLRLTPDGKLTETQPSAKLLYDNYYNIEILNNQWKLQNFETVPFTTSDYLAVKDNPNAFDINAMPIKLESVIYSPWNKIASIKTRVQYTYSTNIQRIPNEPTGE
jgi:hypothetical protein